MAAATTRDPTWLESTEHFSGELRATGFGWPCTGHQFGGVRGRRLGKLLWAGVGGTLGV